MNTTLKKWWRYPFLHNSVSSWWDELAACSFMCSRKWPQFKHATKGSETLSVCPFFCIFMWMCVCVYLFLDGSRKDLKHVHRVRMEWEKAHIICHSIAAAPQGLFWLWPWKRISIFSKSISYALEMMMMSSQKSLEQEFGLVKCCFCFPYLHNDIHNCLLNRLRIIKIPWLI